jgi:hypothetical protein
LTLSYDLSLDDESWVGFPVDVYMAVRIPNNRFFYMIGKGNVTKQRRAIKTVLPLDDIGGSFLLPPIGAGMPAGTYTFYAVLTRIDTSPLNGDNRVTELSTAGLTVQTGRPY